MDLLVTLPGLALAAGLAWPAIARHRIVSGAERTLRNSRARVLPS